MQPIQSDQIYEVIAEVPANSPKVYRLRVHAVDKERVLWSWTDDPTRRAHPTDLALFIEQIENKEIILLP